MLDMWSAHPKGWSNPIVFRASAALPAAGAWDGTPTECVVAGTKFLTLQISYTRGAAGGAMDWQIQSSIYSTNSEVPTGAGEWADESIYAPGAVAAGALTTSLVQAEFQRFTPIAGTQEVISFGPFELQATVEKLRVRARESGNTGTPGTAQITGYAWG